MATPEKQGQNRFIKKAGRVAASVGLFVLSVISPIDSPQRSVNAESNPQQANSLTLLHGNDSERRVRLNIMLLPQNGTTTKMLQEVAEDIFRIPPTNEFKNQVNVYKKNPEEDLKCDQNAICDWQAVNREIDRIVAKGITPHETMVVVKSNEQFRGAGWGLFASSFAPPTIYTPSAVVRPSGVPDGPRREFYASGIAHELWGHAVAGFDHEGNDIMDNSVQGSVRLRFNPQHTQYLRELMRLTPQNYLTPKNGIRLQSIEQGISAVVFTPSGTKQLYSEVRPDDGEGPSIIEHVKDLGLIHAWSETGKRIPYKELSASKPYTWRVCSSGLSLPLSAQGPDQDPRWTKVEAWPGKLFPNPCVEVKFETPDGMVRIYLPVVGK